MSVSEHISLIIQLQSMVSVFFTHFWPIPVTLKLEIPETVLLQAPIRVVLRM